MHSFSLIDFRGEQRHVIHVFCAVDLHHLLVGSRLCILKPEVAQAVAIGIGTPAGAEPEDLSRSNPSCGRGATPPVRAATGVAFLRVFPRLARGRFDRTVSDSCKPAGEAHRCRLPDRAMPLLLARVALRHRHPRKEFSMGAAGVLDPESQITGPVRADEKPGNLPNLSPGYKVNRLFTPTKHFE